MDSLQAFSDALARLEEIQAAMADMAKRTDPAWKREFVELRRQLGAQITAVSAAARQCEQVNSNAEVAASLREGLARMRSTVALHQANWPTVAIDRENSDYVESVKVVRATNRAFIDIARKILADIG